MTFVFNVGASLVDARGRRSAASAQFRSLTTSRDRGARLSLVLLGLLACSFLAPPARAHDPYESWTSAIVHPDRIALAITMAQSTALRLIDPQVKIRFLTPENFAAHRPLLEQKAAAFYLLTADRKPLAARKVEAELTEENDVAFKITFPRPRPGRLHFHAAFLKKLGEGYGGILEVADTEGHHLGWEQLSFENPNLEVTIPAPGSPKKTK